MKHIYKTFFYKIKSAQLRFSSWVIKTFYNTINAHPSSFPYLSGDSFRALCDHVWDSEKKMIPFKLQEIRQGDLIYIAGNHLLDFFKLVSSERTQTFILISGNDDTNITSDLVKELPSSVHHWFAQNCLVTHERITPIPIGLENRRLHWHGNIRDFKRLRGKKKIAPNEYILYGFATGNNKKEREPALKVLQNLSWAYPTGNLNTWYYRRYLRQFGLVASPPGNGEDCHRTWEALYLGVAPIVKRSVLTEYFYSLGLSLVLIDTWEELKDWDIPKRLQVSQKAQENINHPALFMPFWVKKIEDKKKEIS